MSTEAFLRITHLGKSFAGRRVVDDFCLAVGRGEMVSLLGPSGCGKTTTLRMIGGFIEPDCGDILIEDSSVVGIPAERRPVCTVFQNYALFPHMTALENVAYGLHCHGLDRRSAGKRALEMLDTVDLHGCSSHNVTRLSGGQQQRVALARALVLNPKVLLLDEPFSNLDAGLRMQMREEVRRLQSRFNLTTIFVTHDRDEAMAISDHIAVMQDGCIVQVGTPREMYVSPVNSYVARCLGLVNALTIDGRQVMVRPEHIVVGEGDGSLTGIVTNVAFLGHLTRCHIDCDGEIVIADAASARLPQIHSGQRVFLTIVHPLLFPQTEDGNLGYC